MKSWLLPLALGIISAGFIIFTGHISISFVLDRFRQDPFWVVLSVVAIATEVLCAIGITELFKRKHYISALLGIRFLCLALITTINFELGEFAQVSSDSTASSQILKRSPLTATTVIVLPSPRSSISWTIVPGL